MKIIIAPAKQMSAVSEYPVPETLPALLKKTKYLLDWLRALPYEDLKKLLACGDGIARLNYSRYQHMDLDAGLLHSGSAALLSYDGIQYKYMAPQVFEEQYFQYVQKHLRIISGFFGILRPLDAVAPYRLEMQAKLKTDFCSSLYDFWKDSICRELLREEDGAPLIINLASGEYSRAVEKYLPQDAVYVSCIFGELDGDRLREKGVYVKMARGEMVRFMAEENISSAEGMKAFCRLGFAYDEGLSCLSGSRPKLVFVKRRRVSPSV